MLTSANHNYKQSAAKSDGNVIKYSDINLRLGQIALLHVMLALKINSEDPQSYYNLIFFF